MLTNYVYKQRPNQTQDLKCRTGWICFAVTIIGVSTIESPSTANSLFKVITAILELKVKLAR